MASEQLNEGREAQGADRASLRLPACLIIMDGFGLEEPGEGNAISLAKTPVLDELFATRPWVRLEASGEAVGLPAGQMGNSEVGHLNIGAGRVVFQELTRINRACADGSIVTNPEITAAFEAAKAPGAALHLMGLLSDGGVHSSNAHLYALLEAARDAGVPHVMVHCFMDGRDVPPSSGAGYVRELAEVIGRLGAEAPEGGCVMEIASIEGRYYAMDRDNRWDRVERAYDTLASAANLTQLGPVEAMEASYADGVTDEFVVPVALADRGMRDGDAVIFFNFRPDRAREITRALTDEGFAGFERAFWPQVKFVCLTEYDPEIAAAVAFPKEFPDNVLADVLADAGLGQYHIAETEKYAHVTFFLNGGREEEKAGEERKLIASPKVATYDLKPEMSEPEVAEALAAAIDADEADVYIVNFANCDMVGHTGVIPAAVAAVEAVDAGVGRVLDAVARKGGVAFVTADHGNADKMIAPDGTPHTAHTTAPVPFVLVDETGAGLGLSGEEGCLADIAPTLLAAVGLAAPDEMTGSCLLAS
ncbi:2,3-bisphosphoglycerate-independent phosphoglycerate mutase [Adlercreutzia sp. ZJ242]|uniref:2,3-bisphosphoglycerate-independent phosphoglycerate mutase n=1 Tax=Adlercreutzia sp. ZJ242 TaxID=2709409 RepID=UPI0013EAACDE|nr:2,3-bisphosphoglycerate-independent phosphoglycerate mutase [Adlercreutzia sp. ZJ242]